MSSCSCDGNETAGEDAQIGRTRRQETQDEFESGRVGIASSAWRRYRVHTVTGAGEGRWGRGQQRGTGTLVGDISGHARARGDATGLLHRIHQCGVAADLLSKASGVQRGPSFISDPGSTHSLHSISGSSSCCCSAAAAAASASSFKLGSSSSSSWLAAGEEEDEVSQSAVRGTLSAVNPNVQL